MQKRVLALLSDGQPHVISELMAKVGCTPRTLTALGDAGWLRIPDINRGALLVCITPSGVARHHLSKSGDPNWSVADAPYATSR